MILPETVNKEKVYRVHCSKNCNAKSRATDIDPGDVALKAKKEGFVTVPGLNVEDQMSWVCKNCNGKNNK